MRPLMILDRDLRKQDYAMPCPSVMAQIKRAEKKTFPKSEALDFDIELKKQNTEMIVVLAGKLHSTVGEDALVAAYLVYARSHPSALLHKVCVLEDHQRQGIARGLLCMLKRELRNRGCSQIALWVDEARKPARSLYESIGFRAVDQARDYYGPGRNGIRMTSDLLRDW